MASEKKDEQFIFAFTEVGGPEKPALEPEDDSLLDFDGVPAAPEEEEESWEAPATVVVPAAIEEPAPKAEIETPAEPVMEKPAETAVQAVAAPAPEPATAKALKPADIRRAALAWMAKRKPTALAAKVPTRLKRFCASVAAFWSEPGRRKRLLKPHRTAIVEIRADRESCFAESARNSELLPALRETKAKKTSLEAEIRHSEPQLKDSDFLFDEIERWNYAASGNKEYRHVLKRIEELERALNKGSRFERIRQAQVANLLYLAVPEGALHPDELADGWGLIYVTPELDAKLVKEAEPWDCSEDNMMHLAQNIGASALRDVLFSNGVHLAADGSVSVIKPPRRRRPQGARTGNP